MSGLSAFLAQNALAVENIRYTASRRFLDEAGAPVLWELRCITSAEDEAIREGCTRRVPAAKGKYITETDAALYLGRLAAQCTVYPDLKDAALQDSYGVMGADSLLKAMLTPGEYADYLLKAQAVCGFDQTFEELVDEAKN